jgi:septum formation inhibitor MinC
MISLKNTPYQGVLAAFAIVAVLSSSLPVQADAQPVNTPLELTTPNTKDRHSYDTALTQLNEFMRSRQPVLDYEDAVDKFQQYRTTISRQEIGATLFNMYSLVGPMPGAKYYGDRQIANEEAAAQAAATAAAQQAQQAAAQAKASQQRTITTSPKTYVNSAGNTVQSPNNIPAGATARCRDGSYSHSQSRSGTCSSHGGVATWL